MDTPRQRILVVDDNPEFTGMIARLLELNGFQVLVALNGHSALEKITSESCEVVLLDLNLPDMSGMEVLKRIKKTDEDVAVIIITGYGGEQVAVDIMKAGASDFLSKPIHYNTLLKTLESALIIRAAQIEDKRSQHYTPLERFFPFLAHEIRNPLHAIGGSLAIIQRRCDLNDNLLAQSIHIIQEEIQHLTDFVQECLDFVRPPVRSHFTEIQMNDVLPIVLNVISHILGELSPKMKVITNYDPHLPKVYANYEEIKRAFINIIKNGFEAMPEGGEFIIKTAFRPDPSPGWIEIHFVDHGTGITEENKKHLFSPFFTTKLRGTGLGLAICRRIINERHKGKILVESEEGKGMTIRVELPVRQPAETASDR
jgi:signal transduction histidine kinase